MHDVLHVERPAGVQGGGRVDLFVVDAQEIRRVAVDLGRTSSHSVEILSGLAAGDKIILSDMSAWSTHDRLRLH